MFSLSCLSLVLLLSTLMITIIIAISYYYNTIASTIYVFIIVIIFQNFFTFIQILISSLIFFKYLLLRLLLLWLWLFLLLLQVIILCIPCLITFSFFPCSDCFLVLNGHEFEHKYGLCWLSLPLFVLCKRWVSMCT